MEGASDEGVFGLAGFDAGEFAIVFQCSRCLFEVVDGFGVFVDEVSEREGDAYVVNAFVSYGYVCCIRDDQ